MSELSLVLDQLGTAFEEYKTANDQRLKDIEKGGAGGENEAKLAVLEKKMVELETKRAELEAKLNRPPTADEKSMQELEYSKLFDGWLRKGENEGELLRKDVNVGTPASGGLAVPVTLDQSIYNLLQAIGPMRSVCGHLTIGAERYEQLVGKHGATAGWVGEQAARTKTDTPQLVKITPTMGEIYAFPQATQTALDDMFFNVENWLVQEAATTFAQMENAAFTSGDGADKPKGLFATPTDVKGDDKRDFGKIQIIKTGAAGAFGTDPGDNLIDLTTEMKSGHLLNARFMMNRRTQAVVRKIKDKDGNYMWQPGLQAKIPNSLLGYSLVINDDMDGIEAGKNAVAFGDFNTAYVIVDRIGTRLLRDPFTNKPFVGLYMTKRVGGMLKDTEAVKFLNFAAA